jgi:TRAP-type C4-dicarboxylate transport system permease small subunit
VEKAKKIVKYIADFLGYFIPNMTFIVIFITFMLTIISRYVLKAPIAWSYEISILGYMWTMFFGVGKAMEADEHVVFGLVYDNLGKKGQVVCKVIYNLALILLLGAAFYPCIQSLLSKKMVTGVLKLPYTIVFAPMIYMFAEIIIRCVKDIINSIKGLKDTEKIEKVEV